MEVRVCLDGQVDVGEDLVVVGPCGRAKVDGGGGVDFAIELREEEGAEVDGACAGDGLEGSYPLLFYCWGVGAKDQFL